MPTAPSTPFDFDAEVPPGTTRHFRSAVGETYLGEPIKIPVTVINGRGDGPRLVMTAAIHGDELNGVKVLQEAANRYQTAELDGTLVMLHVVNVPAYLSQQRYLPIFDQDLNRSFPGRARATTAERMAHHVFERFVRPCDLAIDFHTSTRNRTTMFHVRADLGNPEVERLADAFGANVILSGEGDERSLRAAATAAGVPALTVEMGKAHRFQPGLIDQALDCIENVLAAYDIDPAASRTPPTWRKVMGASEEKRWIRADTGGLVEMLWGPEPVVYEGEPICTVTDHFSEVEHVIDAPFTGLIVGVLENPIAAPGHPLCHLVRLRPDTLAEVERAIDDGEFDGYRSHAQRWVVDLDLGD